MTGKKDLAKLIFEKLTNNDLEAISFLLSKQLAKEKTEKIGITKTPLLNSIGQELGKLLLKEKRKFKHLKELWSLSLSKKEDLSQGLLSGRELRLIIIGALSVISKKQYEEVKNFIMDILNTIQDWETCDQLALKVVVNLAIQNQKETFSLMRDWIASDNKWIRRLAVATIPPYIRARKQEAEICLKLLSHVMKEEDKDVKKAIGWALREITKKDENAVFEFLKGWATTDNINTHQIIKEGMKKLPQKEQTILNSLIFKNG